ncbi:MAG TPA: hypothetical protein VIW92_03575, partial [Thermoanaerobaculia bacterium]
MKRATLLTLALLAGFVLPAEASETSDLAAARALFAKNFQAIRDKDADTYLSCYLESEGLARTGPTGFTLGYKEMETGVREGGWPDNIEAEDIRLTPVQPGLVYATYRYRMRFGGEEF